MSAFGDHSFSFEQFSGKVRLFPLPNLVMFPYVMQPLHVFEPRYRDLLEDALAGDRLVTMAFLLPGWERNYEGRPAVHPIACLCRIAAYSRLPNGTYNVLLLGMRRVRILRELATDRRFREAEAALCDESSVLQQPHPRPPLLQALRHGLLQILPHLPEANEQLDQLLGNDIPLGMLADVISYMLDIDMPQKQALLAELDAHRRAELLLTYLSQAAVECEPAGSSSVCFPPEFSLN